MSKTRVPLNWRSPNECSRCHPSLEQHELVEFCNYDWRRCPPGIGRDAEPRDDCGWRQGEPRNGSGRFYALRAGVIAILQGCAIGLVAVAFCLAVSWLLVWWGW